MTGQLLIYQTEDGRLKVEARLENETLWLTQQQMAELFQTSQQNISLHLQNVFDEGELQREATHKDFLLVRQEGARQASRKVDWNDWVAVTNPDLLKHYKIEMKQLPQSNEGINLWKPFATFKP